MAKNMNNETRSPLGDQVRWARNAPGGEGEGRVGGGGGRYWFLAAADENVRVCVSGGDAPYQQAALPCLLTLYV